MNTFKLKMSFVCNKCLSLLASILAKYREPRKAFKASFHIIADDRQIAEIIEAKDR